MEATYEPKTLQEAIVYFSDQENCLDYLVARRPEWKNGVICPICGSEKVGFLKNQLRWQCSVRHPKRQFSVKVGTIFEDSPLGLDKWLPAMWMILNCKNGISSCEIARALGVTQKTAWFMLHRIRLAMREPRTKKLGGSGREIEADETFIGGKVENMHKKSRAKISKFNNWGKTPVLGLLEREGRVRAAVAPNRRKHTIQPNIIANVEPGSKLYTDDYPGYDSLPAEYRRELINHLQTYVNGRVHTNGLENFWSLLKRTLKGTYVSVDPCHLQAYVDEQVFRYNNRKDMNDSDRFEMAATQITGKRLTYAELIGKEGETLTVIN